MPTIAVPLGSAFRPLVSGLYANIPVVNNIADAHLMAAAPDLLAAARDTMAWWDEHQFDTTGDHGEYDVYPDTPAFVTAARAAIAKAAGAAERDSPPNQPCGCAQDAPAKPESVQQRYARLSGATTEHDPHGTPPNQPGAKLDAGKTRAGLVLGDFARALEQVARVGTFGAQKYTDHGWLSVPNGYERYTDALLRHFLSEHQGELNDPQTDLPHAAHMAWNALARLELELRAAEAL